MQSRYIAAYAPRSQRRHDRRGSRSALNGRLGYPPTPAAHHQRRRSGDVAFGERRQPHRLRQQTHHLRTVWFRARGSAKSPCTPSASRRRSGPASDVDRRVADVPLGRDPRTLVPSLVGSDGFFYATTEEFARHAKVDEVETEVRAQIERARPWPGTDASRCPHARALCHAALFACCGRWRESTDCPSAWLATSRCSETCSRMLPRATRFPTPSSLRSETCSPLRGRSTTSMSSSICNRRQRVIRSSRARRRGDAGRHRELSGLDAAWRQRDVESCPARVSSASSITRDPHWVAADPKTRAIGRSGAIEEGRRQLQALVR